MSSTTEAERPILSAKQTAAFLDLAEVTLEIWRRKGTGPAFIKAGRRVLYRRSDIEQWLESNRRGGGQ